MGRISVLPSEGKFLFLTLEQTFLTAVPAGPALLIPLTAKIVFQIIYVLFLFI